MKLKDLKKEVELLLKNNPRCRDDDIFLLYKYWTEVQGISIFIPFEKFKELVPFESISRCRRKIQNDEHKFPPSLEVWKARKQQEEKYYEYFGKQS